MYKKFLFLTSFVLVLSLAYDSYGDSFAPLPNPMFWLVPPQETGPYTITMSAVTAIDVNDPPVQYLFTCTTDGTKSSGWQSSPTYEASGLTPNTKYTFNIKAKDNAGNMGGATFNLSATTENNSTPPVLRLDLNTTTDNNDANTQTSFIRFTLPQSGTEINGVIIDLSGIIQSTRRNDPCGSYDHYEYGGLGGNPGNDPCFYDPRAGERLYRDFISGFGVSGVTITLWGLGVNQDCNITIWAYDACSTGDVNRVANWYANGIHIFDTNFLGGTANDPRVLGQGPANAGDLYKYAFSGRGTADAYGRIILTSARAAASPATKPFAFVNALKVEPNKAIAFVPTPYANRPQPVDGSENVPVNTVLKWRNGTGVVKHDLYLGTNFNDVNTATRASHPGVQIYAPNLAADANNGYDPCGATGFLALETTYYWRVDENTPPNVYKGDVWSFTTCPNSVVDDFEEYAPPASADDMRKVWNDYYYGSPGACAVVTPDLATLHLSGTVCSMRYEFYDASYDPYYSEAIAAVDTARPNGLGIDPNWLEMGAKSLSLWFYGQAGNDANYPMYVKLTDGSSNFKQVNYGGDMNDIRVASWHEWNIPLSAFTGVNLGNVKTMTIGFGSEGHPAATDGTVWFDDIKLYTTRCLLGYSSIHDLTGDCVVNYEDISMIARDWQNSKVFYGLASTALGGAKLSTDPCGHLKIGNIGSNGQDGVNITLPKNLILWHADMESLEDPNNPIPDGAFVDVTSIGTINGLPNQVVSVSHHEKTGAYMTTTADFSSLEPTSLTAAYYLSGELVLEEENINPSLASWRSGDGGVDDRGVWVGIKIDIHWLWGFIPLPYPSKIYIWDHATYIVTPQGNHVQADTVAVYAMGTTVSLDEYSDVSITAAGIPEITITNEEVELAGGAPFKSTDINGDGQVNFKDYAILANQWLEEELWPS
jgi:hypothetical protein